MNVLQTTPRRTNTGILTETGGSTHGDLEEQGIAGGEKFEERNLAGELLSFRFGETVIRVQPPLRDAEEGDALFSDPFDDDGPEYDDTGLFGAWPASVVLCRFLHQHPALIKQRRVLELGCGAGLPSLLCAQLGASHTLSTDRNEEVSSILSHQPSLTRSAQSTHCDPTHTLSLPPPRPSQTKVVQRVLEAQHLASVGAELASAQRLDWAEPQHLVQLVQQASIQLLIASDLVSLRSAPPRRLRPLMLLTSHRSPARSPKT